MSKSKPDAPQTPNPASPFLQPFVGALREAADSTWFSDPWNMAEVGKVWPYGVPGLRLLILRDGHDDWQRYLAQHDLQPDLMNAEMQMQAMQELAAASVAQPRKGFRQRNKRQLQGEYRKALEAAWGKRKDEMVNKTKEQQEKELALLRVGVTEILLKGWQWSFLPEGEETPSYTPQLAHDYLFGAPMLGEAAFLPQGVPSSKMPGVVRVHDEAFGDASDMAEEVHDRIAKRFGLDADPDLVQFIKDAFAEEASVYHVSPELAVCVDPREGSLLQVPYGGQALGNAFLAWILQCAKYAEEYRGQTMEAVLGN